MSKQSSKRKMSNRKFLGITVPLVSFLLIFALAANIAAGLFYDTITMWFAGSGADFNSTDAQAARENAEQIARQLEEEGVVLLKNQNDVLPLSTEDSKKISVFGWDSYGVVYGGTGSGAANTEEAVTFYQALENEGFELYQGLQDVYRKYKSSRQAGLNVGSTDFTIYETPMSEYGDDVLQGAKEWSDTALIMFGRAGGEGNDLPKDYLDLSKEEQDLVNWVTDNFENVIVLLNAANAMNLGFIEQNDKIDAALWIGLPGLEGMTGVAEAVSGTVNPSGRLVDTYVYDLTKDPTYYNSGVEGSKEYTDAKGRYYIDYCEGIYVGYRYYETAAYEGFIDYDKSVVYPFGYGLSYTTFEQTLVSMEEKDGTIRVDVKVENTGKTAGKEVVQVYFTAPYDPSEKIEKAYVELIGYAKTKTLQPGKSETVTIEFLVEDMAAYDCVLEGAYVLGAGDYEIKLMKNSHDVIDSRTYSVEEKLVYNEENNGARSTDNIVAKNLFQSADGSNETVPVTYMTRETMILPQEQAPRAASEQVLASATATYTSDPNAKDIVTDVPAGIMLEDMVGLAYDDPKWDTFLNQLSFKEMTELVAYGGYKTKDIESVGKYETIDLDGPNGFNELNTSTTGGGGVAYPCETVIASTWNNELAEDWGKALGAESVTYGVQGWYAPGANIHRSPFDGRNFEYFSEDPLLSGRMAAKTIYGASGYGLYCYVKHFAANETETHRAENGLYTWLNEQSLREIYMLPFELSVKEGGTTAVMSAFNRIGATWAGASKELLTTVLREEWGFQGMVISDYYMVFQSFMDVYAGVVAGNDLYLSGITMLANVITSEDPTIRSAVRNATHNILYTVANSNAYGASYQHNEVQDRWLYLLAALDVILAAAFIASVWGVVKRTRKHRAYIVSLIEAKETEGKDVEVKEAEGNE